MDSVSTDSAQPPSIADALKLFAAYPFDGDDVFQQGLLSIVSEDTFRDKSDLEKIELVLRTKLFYFNRIAGTSLTEEDVLQYSRTARQTSNGATTSETAQDNDTQAEQPTLTFAELKALIESGDTENIPNNRKIPDALNNAPPSEHKAEARKKPWELK